MSASFIGVRPRNVGLGVPLGAAEFRVSRDTSGPSDGSADLISGRPHEPSPRRCRFFREPISGPNLLGAEGLPEVRRGAICIRPVEVSPVCVSLRRPLLDRIKSRASLRIVCGNRVRSIDVFRDERKCGILLDRKGRSVPIILLPRLSKLIKCEYECHDSIGNKENLFR